MTEKVWDKFLTEQDKAHIAILNGGKERARKGFGKRPAILNIDNYRGVAGDYPEPVLDQIKTWPMAMGYAAWEALDHIEDLLKTARAAGIPISHVHSLKEETSGVMPRGGFKKLAGMSEAELDRFSRRVDFMPQSAPLPGEIVLDKAGPSAFFETPLMAALNALDVDTLILTGESTSGCLRASAVDAKSYRFKVIVVEECVYDRHEASHAVNLFDLNQKYADVMPIAEVKEWIARWSLTQPAVEMPVIQA